MAFVSAWRLCEQFGLYSAMHSQLASAACCVLLMPTYAFEQLVGLHPAMYSQLASAAC